MNTETKNCQNCKSSFPIFPEDLAFYERIGVCVPQKCPDCRMIQKLLFRNERTLYRRECGFCGKSMLAMYHPRCATPVYCIECHNGDKWTAKDHAQDFNNSEPILVQFKNLLDKVPKISLSSQIHLPSPGTEYQNFAGGNKDCYLAFNSARNEDCAYIRGLVDSKSSCDCYFGIQNQYCYGNVNVSNSSRVSWSTGVADSMDTTLCRDCRSVQYCFGSVNLHHAKYQFFNEQLSKAEWEEKISEIGSSYEKFNAAKIHASEHEKRYPKRATSNLKTHNCTGNFIYESKDCYSCFEVSNCENCRYALFAKYAKDSQDVLGHGIQSELLYNTVAVGSQCSRIIASWGIANSHDLTYCFDMKNCHDCLFSAGLRHSSYYILNKQYSEEEYRTIRDTIIDTLRSEGVYGDYFPTDLSYWSYNETSAIDVYPRLKEEILNAGYRYEEEIPRTKHKETIKPGEIPDTIHATPDNFLDHIFQCVRCGYNYRIIRNELNLLRTLSLPLPRECPSCRYDERIDRRGLFKLMQRSCSSCGKNVMTAYSESKAPRLYCETCYQNEVV